jgi:hypothetical protein
MKVYISGKISGLPIKQAKAKFKASEQLLKLKGYTPINPFKITPYNEGTTWHEYMLADIISLFYCDAIYMQRDWGMSKGARIEYGIAKELGLTIFFETEYNQ